MMALDGQFSRLVYAMAFSRSHTLNLSREAPESFHFAFCLLRNFKNSEVFGGILVRNRFSVRMSHAPAYAQRSPS